MRLLLVTIYYEPEQTGVAPYATRLAEHWAQQGHDVLAIVGIPHFPTWRREAGALAVSRHNPRVLRARHFIPRRPSGLGRAAYEGTWLLSASAKALPLHADVVVAISPALMSGVAGWLAARRWRVPLGVIFQDLAGPAAHQSGYPQGLAFARLATRIEQFLIRRAQGIVIISGGFRAYVEGAGASPERIYEIGNWAHLGLPTETRTTTRRRLGWGDGDFICLHAGNMGQKQGLDNLIATAAELSAPGIKIVLSGHGNDRSRLLSLGKDLRSSALSFVDLQPPGQFESMLQAADVLLINQRASVDNMALPSKLTSYFAAGRPIAAAVSRTSATAAEINRSGAGIVVPPGNAEALASTLRQLRKDPSACLEFGRRGKEYALRHLHESGALADYDRFLSSLQSKSKRSVSTGGGSTA